MGSLYRGREEEWSYMYVYPAGGTHSAPEVLPPPELLEVERVMVLIVAVDTQ